MSIKTALRRFSLAVPNMYNRHNAKTQFPLDLLECFGWSPDALPVEAGKSFKLAGGERKLGFYWEERRVLLEVEEPYINLELAFPELLEVCVQLSPVPHYVIYTNRTDWRLYEIGAMGSEEPASLLLSCGVDELAKYSEAHPFLRPDWTPEHKPRVIDVARVSKNVADLVATLYRQLIASHPTEKDRAVRFTLQCITAMFAEDIGLMNPGTFTDLLYEARDHGDAHERLHKLFELMSKPGEQGRQPPYFNGGLFIEPAVLELDEHQLDALTKAAEADWSCVDPHIFGSVFQGIMDDAERHASGAHYTAREDIMRVVGPTIIEPWRERIHGTKKLGELQALRKELSSFRVLDPACGSGNFLYVAFRELYKLETELLTKINSFASGNVGWGSGLLTTNFHGIDINPFAVELARVTLNIAKKIAFDERAEIIDERGVQVELSTDPSLPLDNLNDTIMCKDALFTDWPEVDAIIGNPPFLGSQKIRAELGDAYLERLKSTFGVGVLDLCAYWFRRAHDALSHGKRAGLVATSAIRMGKTRRASLDYIVSRGGTITNAVSSRPWPGDAVVHVSLVNWIKDDVGGPHHLIVDNTRYERARIPTHLRLQADVSGTSDLKANEKGTSMGVIFAHKNFQPSSKVIQTFKNPKALVPKGLGGAMLDGKLLTKPKYCIDFYGCSTSDEARQKDPELFEYIEENVLPDIQAKAAREQQIIDDEGKGNSHYITWLSTWWKPQQAREEFFEQELSGLDRMIVCSGVMARPIYCFLSTEYIPTNTMQLFALDDDYSFGIMQSGYHWEWVKIKGGRVKADPRYTVDVWKTFPWPQAPTEHDVVSIAEAARALRQVRADLMEANGWSLRKLYQAIEDVQGSHPLKDAHADLDAAVASAYSHPADMEMVDFLLDLNMCLSEDEGEGISIQGPGLPEGFDADDPRFTSQDCITPPKPFWE